MRKEIWKGIKGYENLYEASNFGRIRSLDRYEVVGEAKRFRKGRILKPIKHSKGYLTVILCKNRKKKTLLIHRLVWEAFNGKIPEGMEVNHINEIKTDNRLSNLNLLTHCQNMNCGTGHERSADKHSQAVLQLTYPGLEFMCEWPSMREAGRNGFYQSCVSKCCKGEQKFHKGVTFRYKKNLLSV